MRAALPARWIDEWLIYDQAYGLPDKRDDIRAGVIAATIVNVQPVRKGRTRKAKYPQDFFLSLRPESNRDPSSSTDLKSKLVAAWGPNIRKAADVNNSESGGHPRP